MAFNLSFIHFIGIFINKTAEQALKIENRKSKIGVHMHAILLKWFLWKVNWNFRGENWHESQISKIQTIPTNFANWHDKFIKIDSHLHRTLNWRSVSIMQISASYAIFPISGLNRTRFNRSYALFWVNCAMCFILFSLMEDDWIMFDSIFRCSTENCTAFDLFVCLFVCVSVVFFLLKFCITLVEKNLLILVRYHW